jgi:regulator of cell morphogenesis and NO signaling
VDAESLSESVSAGLQREHHEIDEGLATLTTVARSHEHDPGAVTRAIHALRRHIYLEEEFLFPPLAEAGLLAPVFVMLREHTQIWTTLDALQRELDDNAGTGPATRALAHQLAIQLQHHNLKEEKILYPQADQVLTASATRHLQAFLRSGQLPQDWVPTKART